MGITFKENVADIRNSKVVDIVNELKDFGVDVDVTDPHADLEEVLREYGFSLIEQPRANYDAIIVAVSHKEYIADGSLADLPFRIQKDPLIHSQSMSLSVFQNAVPVIQRLISCQR